MKQKLLIRFTGKKGKVDGYVESILGLFAMTGVLVKPAKLTKRYFGVDEIHIYMDCELLAPPLGHLGEKDMEIRDESLPD